MSDHQLVHSSDVAMSQSTMMDTFVLLVFHQLRSKCVGPKRKLTKVLHAVLVVGTLHHHQAIHLHQTSTRLHMAKMTATSRKLITRRCSFHSYKSWFACTRQVGHLALPAQEGKLGSHYAGGQKIPAVESFPDYGNWAYASIVIKRRLTQLTDSWLLSTWKILFPERILNTFLSHCVYFLISGHAQLFVVGEQKALPWT